jgi:hypothetical protein
MTKQCTISNDLTGTCQFLSVKGAHWRGQAQFFDANSKYGFLAHGLLLLHYTPKLLSATYRGALRENGHLESFNAHFPNDVINGGIFCTLKKVRILKELWRHHYDIVRLHSMIWYQPPDSESVIMALLHKSGEGSSSPFPIRT